MCHYIFNVTWTFHFAKLWSFRSHTWGRTIAALFRFIHARVFKVHFPLVPTCISPSIPPRLATTVRPSQCMFIQLVYQRDLHVFSMFPIVLYCIATVRQGNEMFCRILNSLIESVSTMDYKIKHWKMASIT